MDNCKRVKNNVSVILTDYGVCLTGWPPRRAHRQPSNHTGQNCIVLGRKFFDVKDEVRDVNYYYWNDASCTIALPFVCQRVATFHRGEFKNTKHLFKISKQSSFVTVDLIGWIVTMTFLLIAK